MCVRPRKHTCRRYPQQAEAKWALRTASGGEGRGETRSKLPLASGPQDLRPGIWGILGMGGMKPGMRGVPGGVVSGVVPTEGAVWGRLGRGSWPVDILGCTRVAGQGWVGPCQVMQG